MILKDPNFVESSEHSTHNTEQTPCMLKFKNHFDLLVDKKTSPKIQWYRVYEKYVFDGIVTTCIYIHTCAVDEMAVFRH